MSHPVTGRWSHDDRERQRRALRMAEGAVTRATFVAARAFDAVLDSTTHEGMYVALADYQMAVSRLEAANAAHSGAVAKILRGDDGQEVA